MANFCTNCGNRLGKDDAFCTNCGTKIVLSDMEQNKSMPNSIEKKKAKEELKRVVGGGLSYNKTFSNTLAYNGLDIVHTGKAIKQQVEKEIESGQIKSAGVEFRVNQLILEYKTEMEKGKKEYNKKIKMIDVIFESDEIKSAISENKTNRLLVTAIKDNLKDKLINKRENMSEDQIRYFIKSELKKDREEREKTKKSITAKEKEMRRKTGENETSGGYCSHNCVHFYEEYLDEDGAIIGYASGMSDYYCALGHPASYGIFCEDYTE